MFRYNFGLSRRAQARGEENSSILAGEAAPEVTKVSLAQNFKG
jgi:hypothetical protein